MLKMMSTGEAKAKKCLPPCKSKSYYISEIGNWYSDKSYTKGKGLQIVFENEVDVTKSSYQLDVETLMSKIGGYIGISKNFMWLIILFLTSIGSLVSFIKLQIFVSKSTPISRNVL